MSSVPALKTIALLYNGNHCIEIKILYHCKAHVCFLQRRAVVGSVTCYSNNLPLLQNRAVNDTCEQQTDTHCDMPLLPFLSAGVL